MHYDTLQTPINARHPSPDHYTAQEIKDILNTKHPNPADSDLRLPQEVPDAYIVRYSDVAKGTMPQAGSTIALTLQKYHFSSKLHQFQPAFAEPLPLTFRVDHAFDRQDDNYDLPYQLDGYAVEIGDIPFRHREDLALIAIQQQYRLIFRYDPRQGLGCLVHTGVNLAPCDHGVVKLLWRTAVNRDIASFQANANILRLASRSASRHIEVIPSER